MNVQTAFSCVFKERIKNMPDDIDDKGIFEEYYKV